MSDINDSTLHRRRRIWAFHGAALAAALGTAAPAAAQSAEDLNSTELNRVATAEPIRPAMTSSSQPVAPAAPSPPIYPAQDYAYYPADIDCDNPYYASYCLAYATWLNQYYAAYGYGYAYPYDYLFYGYPVDVAFGIGFFRGHRFHNFHHFAFAHGLGFHGGFHGGGFHGGHGGGGHR
jgi:hypothetical protein